MTVQISQVPLCALTIYLINESYQSEDLILKSKSNLTKFPIRSRSHIGDLYVQSTRSNIPRWASFFDGYVNANQFGKVSSPAAVFLVRADRRMFAITFGQGRHLLDPGCWEERFGLKVALNCIGENQLRSIDKRSFDALSLHTREQASHEAKPEDFGLDIEQDLLRAVTGAPNDSQLGQSVSGMDALTVRARVELENIQDLLSLYYRKFQDTSYRSRFPWVDHIAEVTSVSLRQTLDTNLVSRIQSQSFDRCWLAAPEIIDWGRVSGFRYGFGARSPELHDIHFPSFLESVDDPSEISRELLNRRRIYCMEGDTQLHTWPVYRCIYCELDLEGNSYHLSGGKWYRVDTDFVETVNASFRQIPRYETGLPEYNDTSEGAYNQRVAQEHPQTFTLMDEKLIPRGGGPNKIEFCDLLSRSNDLIHVKRYGGSSVLSHLFAQGKVSAELFLMDKEFRAKLNGILPEIHRLSNVNDRPVPDRYQVVFAVVSDRPEDLTLPFFSRLNLRHAVRTLQAYGYKVALAKISVNETLAKLSRYAA